jgi:hypothetical protein
MTRLQQASCGANEAGLRGSEPEPKLKRTSGNPEIFHRSVQDLSHNRRMVLTRRGYFGLAPAATVEGDLCCILFGGAAPFVIRRTERTGHYKLVGDVFVTGTKVCIGHFWQRKMEVIGTWESKDWVDFDVKEEVISLC